MKVHELKCWTQFFERILDGTKTFELRKNDRDFQVGDFLLLREYDPETQRYSGRLQYVRVPYILGSEEHSIVGQKALHPDYVILAVSLSWSAQVHVLPGQEWVSPTRPESIFHGPKGPGQF